MAKEESKKEKKSKSKAAAKAASAAAAAPDARAVVVASVAAFLEAGGFPRALSALQSEANLEGGAWKSSAVSLEDLVSKFLETSAAPATVTMGSNEKDKATDAAAEDTGKKKKSDDTELNEAKTNVNVPSAVQDDETREKKKKKKKKGDDEASELETKVIEPSAEEKPAENVEAETKEKKQKKKKDDSSVEEAKETVKSDDQKVDGKKKKSKKQEKDDDVEARLEKASLAIEKKLKGDGGKSKEEALKPQNDDIDNNDVGNGAVDKSKKKKKGKSEKIDAVSVAAEADGVETVKDDNDKKAKKKRKKSDSEENVQEEGKEVAGKGLVPTSDDQDKSAMETEDAENGRPASENAVVGKKRKLEDVEESKPPATENGTANQTSGNGFAEDNSKENSIISKPSKRQKKSDEPKSVTPFQRVKLEAVKFADERLQDNSYWAKGGAETGYGAKAQEVLGQVRGRGFRHEKTKKKRGTYRGGQIDLGTHSIKFDNSDDE
ncbi:hypothetical protein QOZ80_5BG0446500 [Eleusine coracana subsp. coracana]|nr:hypothetical protein QOZ80_5BG0446500 [Eleusine coracana subsp. coracana]